MVLRQLLRQVLLDLMEVLLLLLLEFKVGVQLGVGMGGWRLARVHLQMFKMSTMGKGGTRHVHIRLSMLLMRRHLQW